MMDQAYSIASENVQATRSCHHYWVIESPSSPMSRGLCQLCDAVREFKNYIEEDAKPEDGLIVQFEDWDS